MRCKIFQLNRGIAALMLRTPNELPEGIGSDCNSLARGGRKRNRGKFNRSLATVRALKQGRRQPCARRRPHTLRQEMSPRCRFHVGQSTRDGGWPTPSTKSASFSVHSLKSCQDPKFEVFPVTR